MRTRPGWLRELGILAAINLASSLVMPAVLVIFGPPPGWHSLWVHFLYGSVYSWCIGTPSFYLLHHVGLPVARLRPGYRMLVYLLSLLVVALAGSIAANLFFVAAGWEPSSAFRHNLGFGLKVSFSITLTLGTLIVMFEMLLYRLQAATLELRSRQLAEERARQLATEAQLSSLESRIHPHFLFNTLNSISSLIREDPAKAERTVERLAALLRYSLDVNARRLATLGQELRIVEDYLEIEKTRFGERLRYTIEIPREMLDLEVPPLALQTLVENSIKHAVAASRHGGHIRVAGRIEGEQMVLEVSDDGPGFDLRALKPGHGLENLQDRLAAIFGGAGRLEIARRDPGIQVSVALPLRKVTA